MQSAVLAIVNPSGGGLYRDKFRRAGGLVFRRGRFFRGRFHFATPAPIKMSWSWSY